MDSMLKVETERKKNQIHKTRITLQKKIERFFKPNYQKAQYWSMKKKKRLSCWMVKLKKKNTWLKKDKKKHIESTPIYLSNLQLGSWDGDNLIESKLKKIMKPNYKNIQLKKDKKNE